MPKYLVLIEAPGKINKFQKTLGKDYEVLATQGHFRDLPKNKLGIDIKNNFEPTYEIVEGRNELVKAIKDKSKKVECIYLFTDLDREGEYISASILDILPDNIKYFRCKTDSLSDKDIKNAIKYAEDNNCMVNMDLVHSAECRRILDRLVGFKCSFITTQATGGKSAGRVQSPALRILVEREKEIQNFIPIKYWDIQAKLSDTVHNIEASIYKPKPLEILSQDTADEICDIFRKNVVIISDCEQKEVMSKPYAPFTTSTLLQAASSILGWSSDKTSTVSQLLYQNSYCTYIRTDSQYIVPDKISEMRDIIENKYGSKYLPSSPLQYINKKNAQEAHEAIRPVDFSILSVNGSADENKLYKMIYKRAISSQMKESISLRMTIDFQPICSNKYTLRSSGGKLIFDGWRSVWDYGKSQDVELPLLIVGDKINLIEIESIAKETVPPNRYTEASLIKKLEELGIGRPSTYKTILTTLSKREYSETKNKSFHVTKLGMDVSDFLVQANFCFVDLNFTSNLEELLDKIAQSKETKITVLGNFWKLLQENLENAKTIKNTNQITQYVCPKCLKDNINSFLLKKNSKFGSFYSCEKYSDKVNKCDYIANIGEDGKPIDKVKKEIIVSDYVCPKCSKKMVERQSKYGKFYGCSAFPSCKCMLDANGQEIIKKQKKTYKYGKKAKE